MTNINKINAIQKIEMGEFMASHPDLAKNIIPSSVQGKVKASQLWEELSRKLNACGPPIKDAKAWRKVFADQKYSVKKKLSFNKSSKRRTSGGPYEEKVLTATEELLMEASGLETSVEGLTVASFGRFIDKDEDVIAEEIEYLQEPFDAGNFDEEFIETPSTSAKKRKETSNRSEEKFEFLKENVKVFYEMQNDISSKIDTLTKVNENILELKKAKFNHYLEFKEKELKMKKEHLEKLDKLIVLQERLVKLKENEDFLNNLPEY